LNLRFLLTRFVSTLSVMLIVALLCFVLLRLAPADPAAILAGDNASASQVEAIRQNLGLDRSLPVQFLSWVGALVRGDFGESFFFKQPVSSLILARIGPTMALAIYATLITILVAVPLGIIAAKWQDSIVDRLIMSLAVLSFSLPVFVVGYCLIFVFSITLGLFPIQGYQPLQNGFGGFLERLTLPAITASLPYIALITRMTRASVLGVLKEDYIRAARAKGQSELKVLFRHALKNAGVPIITSISAGFAFLLGGVVVTESVFNLPGLGRLTVEAVLAGDYPIIQTVVLLFAFMIVMINLATDLVYRVVDPRIKY
jgi:peptide/nickel transport system permease protein